MNIPHFCKSTVFAGMFHISTTKMSMVMTFNEGLPYIKSNNMTN